MPGLQAARFDREPPPPGWLAIQTDSLACFRNYGLVDGAELVSVEFWLELLLEAVPPGDVAVPRLDPVTD